MLFKTSKIGFGRAGHDHIAYIGPNGLGETSENKKHAHTVQIVREPMMDPMTGMSAVDPNTMQPMMGEPRIVIGPGGKDGHTHEVIGEVERKEKPDKETDLEKVSKVRAMFKAAKEYEKESREKAQESVDFYCGKQWSDKHKSELEGKNRAALTINLVQPFVDVLCGYQRQNRSDIKFVPVEEGDARAADIYTAIVKNICERNDFEYTEAGVFEDICLAGRGAFHSFVNFDKNLEGDILIERQPWDECYLGPHDKLDFSDCDYQIKAKWYSRKKLEQLWPDKAEEIQVDFDAYYDENGEFHHRTEHDQYRESTNDMQIPFDPDFIDLTRKEYRVLQCEQVVHERIPMLVHAANDFVFNADGWSGADISSVKTIPGFSVIYRPVDKMWVCTAANTVLLEEDTIEEPEFSLSVAYGKKRAGDWWGKVYPALDAQREINKRHSQAVDIINKMASYGYFYEEGAFENPMEEKKFKEQSTSPGFTIKISNMNKKPIKEEGVKFPVEIVQLEESAIAKLREIMAVNPELMGQQGQARSGIAMLEQKKQGLLANEFLFDNLNLAKKLLGRRLVRLIQKAYDPERILRILGNKNKRSPVNVGGKPLPEHDPQELIELLKNEEITKYDIVVSQSAHSPTTLMSNFVMLLEMAQTGIPIPPDMMIQASPMSPEDKDAAMRALQAQAQAKVAEDAKKYGTEIEKTIASKAQTPQEARMSVQGQNQGQMPAQMPPQGGRPPMM